MGFFSQCCEGCSREVMAWYAVQDGNAPYWMAEAVVIDAQGKLDRGVYDGYGRLADNDGMSLVNERESAMAGWPTTATVWHAGCWELSGQPKQYVGPSKNAPAQGFFRSYPRTSKPKARTGRAAAKAVVAQLLYRNEWGSSSVDGQSTPARGFLSAAEVEALRTWVAR